MTLYETGTHFTLTQLKKLLYKNMKLINPLDLLLIFFLNEVVDSTCESSTWDLHLLEVKAM